MSKHIKDAKRLYHTSAEYANAYDGKIKLIIPDYEKILKSTIAAIPFPVNKEFVILELGYGTGNLTALILNRFKQSLLYGIDYSPYMEKIARRKLRASGVSDDNAIFHCDDITKSDYSWVRSKIDVVIGTFIFHDLDESERDEFLDKAHGILSQNAIIIIGDAIGSVHPRLRKRAWKRWVKSLSEHSKMSSTEILDLFRHAEMIEMLHPATIDDLKMCLSKHNLGGGFEVCLRSGHFAIVKSKKVMSRQKHGH